MNAAPMNARVTFGLRARASVAATVLVVALAALATIVVKRADGALHDVERARFTASAEELADAVSYGVLAHSEALAGPALDAFSKNPDLVDVVIVDAPTGAPIASRTHASSGSSNATSAGAPNVANDADVIEVRAPVRTRTSSPGDDGELAAFGVGASSEPRVIGEVRARFSSRAVEEIQKKTRREIVLAALGLGLFGLIAAGLLMTTVVRRVRTVADAAAKVRAGARDVSVTVDGGDELTQLAADFNAMTRALDEAAHALAERESLAAIGRATAVIAHELKNPLGIVLGAAQIVSNESKPMSARTQAASIVEEEVRRLARTLEDLLAYARPRAPEKKRVDVRAACELAAARALHAGGPMHERTVDVTGSLAWVDVDEGQLQQVLLNLVQNAAQAGATRVTLTIEVGARISVDDDGPGITAAMREQLFLPFATTKQRGTGLGLAASRRMMRDNGGDLAYESTANGTRFVITLPSSGDDDGNTRDTRDSNDNESARKKGTA